VCVCDVGCRERHNTVNRNVCVGVRVCDVGGLVREDVSESSSEKWL
jgi:hypothetical protein